MYLCAIKIIMASNIGLGSRFKMLIHIDGLGDAHLSDDDVDISAEFYINGKYNSRSYLVEKSEMTMVESESTYSADCSGAGYKSAGISLSEGAWITISPSIYSLSLVSGNTTLVAATTETIRYQANSDMVVNIVAGGAVDDVDYAITDFSDDYIAICDTTGFTNGNINAVVTVEYPDVQTGKSIKEVLIVSTGVTAISPS